MTTRGLRTCVLCGVLSVSLPALSFAQIDQPTQSPPVRPALQPPGASEEGLPSIPSIAGLFRLSFDDFRALPSGKNLAILGAGLAASGAFRQSDTTVSRTLSSRWSASAFDASALTGQFPLHLAAGLAAYSLGQATASSRVALLGADLVRAQLLAQGTTQAIKFAVNRTRPDGTAHSFPSGHTSTMFATATVLQQHFGWKAGVPAYAAASYVAAGRIQGKRHYLSDVALGAALGIAAGRTVTIGRGSAKFVVAPMASEAGVGVGFTLTK